MDINTVSKDTIQKYFRGAETAFVFIMPTDLSDITQLTRSLLDVATEAGVGARRFAWIVPACPVGTELGDRSRSLQHAAHYCRKDRLRLQRNNNALERFSVSRTECGCSALLQKTWIMGG